METITAASVEKTTQELIIEALSAAFSYQEYRAKVDLLANEGKSTGPDQTESLANYTQLNNKRMKRWDKTFKIPADAKEKIQLADRNMIWLVLTESWCGDAAPAIPVMNRIAESNAHISLKILLRDEHPELMNRFLTNGGKSIPKLIVIDYNTMQVIGEWGPRPSHATEMANEYKQANGHLSSEFKQNLQLWYNADKGLNTLEDLVQLLPLK